MDMCQGNTGPACLGFALLRRLDAFLLLNKDGKIVCRSCLEGDGEVIDSSVQLKETATAAQLESILKETGRLIATDSFTLDSLYELARSVPGFTIMPGILEQYILENTGRVSEEVEAEAIKQLKRELARVFGTPEDVQGEE